MATRKNNKKSLFHGAGLHTKVVVIGAIVSVVLMALTATGYVLFKKSTNPVNTEGFQAVFLENGQVYFGRLSNINSNYVLLTNVYYLQANQDVQGDNKDKEEDQPQLQLNKLGNELHGPEDAMWLSRGKITFWENLKSDSQVVKAIENQKD